jgi:predicted RNA-binding protein with RPS1 domain
VLGINAQEKKIALSIKRTQAEPWSQVASKYEVGQLVRGTVTQLANFGAFARIEDGIEGLIHVSELTDERITHPKQVVKEGDELLLRIIRIDPQRRRMGLSLRRALDTPDEELMAVFGEGALEERDRIVANIHAALEAEGIEIGSGRASAEEVAPNENAADQPEPPADQPVRDDRVQVVSTGEAPAPDVIGAPAKQEPATVPAEKAPRASRSSEKPELPAELADGSLSAMELAFAMAGADLELEDENDESGEGGDSKEQTS